MFAALGLPNAEERLLKANIVAELHRLIKQRELTQVKAAKLIGIHQPDLSLLLRGDFEDYSAERLMKMLTVFEPPSNLLQRKERSCVIRTTRLSHLTPLRSRLGAAHLRSLFG